jgi:hypothetical protein
MLNADPTLVDAPQKPASDMEIPDNLNLDFEGLRRRRSAFSTGFGTRRTSTSTKKKSRVSPTTSKTRFGATGTTSW